MRRAKKLGFTVVVYFVATRHPQINVERVRQRVAGGGHDVPADRIIARYHRTMAMLPDAIAISDSTYLIDNSRIYDGSSASKMRFVACIEAAGTDFVKKVSVPQPVQEISWAEMASEQRKGLGYTLIYA